MNYKQIGDIGQNVAIGELSKYGLGIAFPLSDNYPFDFIVISGTTLYKAQVKSSSDGKSDEYATFALSHNNWYNGNKITYSPDEVDVMICVCLRTFDVYILGPEDFEGRRSITIRLSQSTANAQRKNIHWSKDFVLNKERAKKVFNQDTLELTNYLSCKEDKKFNHTCQECGELFTNGYKKAKYCNKKCVAMSQRKVIRPAKDVLNKDIQSLNWRLMGRKYGVTDNAVKKWARVYGLI